MLMPILPFNAVHAPREFTLHAVQLTTGTPASTVVRENHVESRFKIFREGIIVASFPRSAMFSRVCQRRSPKKNCVLPL